MRRRPLDPLRHFFRRIPAARLLVRRARLLFSPRQRQIEALIARDDIALFQPFPTTSPDRYPSLFDALAGALAPVPSPRILSFGCASGAEVRALRQRLPGARITGIDTNPRAVAQARKADPLHFADYLVGDRPPPGDVYDVILALAVFRDGRLGRDNPRENCAEILPFAKVEAGLTRLDAALRNGGYLAIANANFRLSDMAIAGDYTPVQVQRVPASKVIYGPDNRLLPGVRYGDVLFRKRGPAIHPTSDAPSQ